MSDAGPRYRAQDCGLFVFRLGGWDVYEEKLYKSGQSIINVVYKDGEPWHLTTIHGPVDREDIRLTLKAQMLLACGNSVPWPSCDEEGTMNCPLCRAPTTYVGVTSVECATKGCSNYKAPVIVFTYESSRELPTPKCSRYPKADFLYRLGAWDVFYRADCGIHVAQCASRGFSMPLLTNSGPMDAECARAVLGAILDGMNGSAWASGRPYWPSCGAGRPHDPLQVPGRPRLECRH